MSELSMVIYLVGFMIFVAILSLAPRLPKTPVRPRGYRLGRSFINRMTPEQRKSWGV